MTEDFSENISSPESIYHGELTKYKEVLETDLSEYVSADPVKRKEIFDRVTIEFINLMKIFPHKILFELLEYCSKNFRKGAVIFPYDFVISDGISAWRNEGEKMSKVYQKFEKNREKISRILRAS